MERKGADFPQEIREGDTIAAYLGAGVETLKFFYVSKFDLKVFFDRRGWRRNSASWEITVPAFDSLRLTGSTLVKELSILSRVEHLHNLSA
jgi:hypothetical protein